MSKYHDNIVAHFINKSKYSSVRAYMPYIEINFTKPLFSLELDPLHAPSYHEYITLLCFVLCSMTNPMDISYQTGA